MRSGRFRSSCRVIGVLLLAATNSLAAEPSPAVVDDVLLRRMEAGGYACVELTRTKSGYLVVPAVLEGKELSLIVDTGAPCAHLDVARLRAAGIPWPTSVGRTRKLEKKSATSSLTSRRYEPFDGLLGTDVLIAGAAVIDYPTKRLYLRPPRK